eukprot:14691299-Alexandrium_andersonii.AAC.1
MSASLVGSEMCIRDSASWQRSLRVGSAEVICNAAGLQGQPCGSDMVSVSYTHLTLPTICSV